MGFVRKFIEQASKALSEIPSGALLKAEEKNPWFIPYFVQHRLNALKTSLIEEKDTICKCLQMEIQADAPQIISIVAAGNIPLVCWHDVVCCLAYAAAHPKQATVEIKLSSKDDVLLPAFFDRLSLLDNALLDGIDVQFVNNVDATTQAVLFTGGSLAQSYYSRTFLEIPLLLRTGRSSVAVLRGEETSAQLEGLAEDCFMYFGLGCRNVSLLLVPAGFDFEPFAQKVRTRFGRFLSQHEGYSNAFRHARACQAMEIPWVQDTDSALKAFFVLKEQEDLSPPMGVLHYLTYENFAETQHFVEQRQQVIQCVAGTTEVPFGSTQRPLFTDFADGLNTVEWLQKLSC